MRKEFLICDNCKGEVLSAEATENRWIILNSVNCNIINFNDKQFCSITCLGSWVNNTLGPLLTPAPIVVE